MEASRLRLVRAEPAQIGLVMLLLASSVVAWLLTDDRMAGMDHGPGSDLGSLGFYAGVWVAMMAAMMFPSIAPMVRSYGLGANASKRSAPGLAPAQRPCRVAGYLVRLDDIRAGRVHAYHRGVEAPRHTERWRGTRAAAGFVGRRYRLRLRSISSHPAKDACLTRCRSHRETSSWSGGGTRGSSGALRLGTEHGAWCVGCCWALMASLFALGVMSLGWMAFVAGLIAIEKLLPWKALANRGIAALLLLLALGIAVAPESVPGLTVPAEHEMHSM